jgi:putative superfamily III holin-X
VTEIPEETRTAYQQQDDRQRYQQAYEPRPEDRSVGELVGEVTKDISTLLRQEVELAKAEVREEASKVATASGMFGGAGVAGLLLAVFASLALMFALGAVLPLGWAALIVAVLWAVVGLVLYALGRSRLRSVRAPERTVQTLKEDVQWAKSRAS